MGQTLELDRKQLVWLNVLVTPRSQRVQQTADPCKTTLCTALEVLTGRILVVAVFYVLLRHVCPGKFM